MWRLEVCSAMSDLIILDDDETGYECGYAGVVERGVDPGAALLLARGVGWLED